MQPTDHEALPPLSVVVSYSHKDEEHRLALERVLSTLRRQRVIDIWSDHRICPGSNLDSAILEALGKADLIVLLISYDFIASDYCYLREMIVALARHDERKSVVIPLIVRPCDWESLPFGRLKALPADGRAITTWENQDSAWLDVAKSLRTLIDDHIERRHRASTGAPVKTVRDHLRDEFSRLAKRFESPDNIALDSLSTGLRELDSVLDGLHNGDFVIFSGRPNMGHHDLALGCAIHSALKQNTSVLYISPRDSGSQVMRRCISSVARVSWQRLSSGDLSEDDWPRVSAAIAILSESKISIDDFGISNPASLVARVEDYFERCEPGLVVIECVDYFASDARETLILSRKLKGLGKKRSVPVLCSLTMLPGPECRLDKRPALHDLKTWQCLEEEADQIAMFYRDDVYEPGSIDAGLIEISVVKNRHGPLHTIVASFVESCRRVENYPAKQE